MCSWLLLFLWISQKPHVSDKSLNICKCPPVTIPVILCLCFNPSGNDQKCLVSLFSCGFPSGSVRGGQRDSSPRPSNEERGACVKLISTGRKKQNGGEKRRVESVLVSCWLWQGWWDMFRSTEWGEYTVGNEACLYEHSLLILFQQIWAGRVNLYWINAWCYVATAFLLLC